MLRLPTYDLSELTCRVVEVLPVDVSFKIHEFLEAAVLPKLWVWRVIVYIKMACSLATYPVGES